MSPDPIQPISLDGGGGDASRRGKSPGPWVWLILAAVIVGAGLFGLWRVRESVASKPDQVRPSLTPTPKLVSQPTPTPDPTIQERLKAVQQEILDLQVELTERGVALWGSDAYGVATNQLATADEAYIEPDYPRARIEYAKTLDQLNELMFASEDAVPDLVTLIENHYGRGEVVDASTALSALLAIDPDHAMKDWEARIAVSDQTYSLLQAAKKNAAEGKPELALIDARNAIRLDAEFPQLKEVALSIERALGEQEFQKWISETLTALHRDDIDTAQVSLKKAQEFAPGHPATKDAAAQVDAAVRARDTAAKLSAAHAAAKRGDWKGALRASLEAVEISPEHAEALRAKDLYSRCVRIHERIRVLTKTPTSREAQLLWKELESVRAKADWPLKLKEEADAFISLAKTANTPIPVMLTSDGLSEVFIVRTKKLPPFQRQVILLKPGTYTAKVSRTGFVDKRVEFTVPMNGKAPAVDLRVSEAL